MLSSIKRVLLTLTILTVVAFVGIYFYTKDRTYYNADTEIGNTLGNIYNGGVFCVQGNVIYFSNDKYKGKLYRMDYDCNNITKLSDDKAVYINADENYIYYSKAVDTKQYSTQLYSMFNNTGIYRIPQNGGKLKCITSEPGGFTLLQGNDLFAECYNAEDSFHMNRFSIDGKTMRELIRKQAIPFAFSSNTIYFNAIEDDFHIHSMELASYNEKVHFSGSYAYPIIQGNYVYYIDPANHQYLCRMNTDGSNPTVLLKKPCSTYNITSSGKFIYYQVNGTKKDYLGRLNLETMDTETVKKGHYKAISVAGFYVFFKDVDTNKNYKTLADQSIDVTQFKGK